jgi:hypothetical protein
MGDEDEIRGTERERLRALRERDINAAELLHAEDFELITPDGARLTKDPNLDRVRTGVLRHLRWEPDDIRVHLYDGCAAIRYTSTIEAIDDGEHFGPNRYWDRMSTNAGTGDGRSCGLGYAGRSRAHPVISFAPLSSIDPNELLALLTDRRVLRHMPLAGPEPMRPDEVAPWVESKEAITKENGYGPQAILIDGTSPAGARSSPTGTALRSRSCSSRPTGAGDTRSRPS